MEQKNTGLKEGRTVKEIYLMIRFFYCSSITIMDSVSDHNYLPLIISSSCYNLILRGNIVDQCGRFSL